LWRRKGEHLKARRSRPQTGRGHRIRSRVSK
jgi:hypothetical protein